MSALGGEHQGLAWAWVKQASHSLPWSSLAVLVVDSAIAPQVQLQLRGDLGTHLSQTVTCKDIFLNTKQEQNLGNGKYKKHMDCLFSGPFLADSHSMPFQPQAHLFSMFLGPLPGFPTPEFWPCCHRDCRMSSQRPLPLSYSLPHPL